MKIRYPAWARIVNGKIDTGNAFGPLWIALPCRIDPQHVERVRDELCCAWLFRTYREGAQA